MQISRIKVEALICPLCGKGNSCGNQDDKSKTCWCADPAITFPKGLLAQIPEHLQGKACICKSCVNKFQIDSASA
ncbi:cysteine-rich CWC family protein [Vibrio halioticoli]|uniref:cysteine-rich CWC family protein n=1 Tax=Vibrio halioticoli TaxID=71388 RepID=UPI000587D8A7|nr:cysteine-rich CWC family protein [Vibrio halioticoli]